MKHKELQYIHESLINGQRRQMVQEIDRYGPSQFFADYIVHLNAKYVTAEARWNYYTDVVVSYFRIKGRE